MLQLEIFIITVLSMNIAAANHSRARIEVSKQAWALWETTLSQEALWFQNSQV